MTPPAAPDVRTIPRVLSALACLALAALALLPVRAFFVSEGGLLPSALVAATLLAAVFRPGHAWVGIAALSPAGILLGRAAGSSVALTEPLVLAFLGGWLLHEAVRAQTSSRPATPWPGDSGRGRASALLSTPLLLALLYAGIVAASVLTQLVVGQLWDALPRDYLSAIVTMLSRGFYETPGRFPAIRAGTLPLEGMGLLAATIILSRRQPELIARGAWGSVATASAIALVTLAQVLAGRPEGTPWPVWAGSLLRTRASSAVPDVNAAGSYFAMIVFLAGGLAAAGRVAARYSAGACAVLALVGLWLSGSRTALVAALLVGCALTLIAAASRGAVAAKRLVPAAFGLLVVAAAFWLVIFQFSPRPVASALRWRTELAATAGRMTEARPVFGVGVGRFHPLSYEYASREWRRIVPHENAHNNFLQELAELGSIGFATFLGLLAAVLHGAMRRIGRPPAAPWLVGATSGLVAFILTWLAGHPLLTREVALAFWLVIGLVAGASAQQEAALPAGAGATARRWRRAAWVAALLLAFSVPVRAWVEIGRSDLSRAGMGFSQWHIDAEGVRFRWMASRAIAFAPAGASVSVVPLRSPSGPATVKVLIGGRLATQRVIDGGGWQDVRVALPKRWGPVPIEIRIHRMPAGTDPEGVHPDTRVQVGLQRVGE